MATATASGKSRKGFVQARDLLRRIQSNSAPLIVDPRSPVEFKRGHLPGAVNAPLGKLLLNTVPMPEDRTRDMVIACMHGQRAWMAQKILAFRGYHHTVLLEGYLQEWIRAGLPVEK
jgi:rhodanese-related sulfurtransferase